MRFSAPASISFFSCSSLLFFPKCTRQKQNNSTKQQMHALRSKKKTKEAAGVQQ
jgi:hypothetical protein